VDLIWKSTGSTKCTVTRTLTETAHTAHIKSSCQSS